jgi:hypothetical protein
LGYLVGSDDTGFKSPLQLEGLSESNPDMLHAHDVMSGTLDIMPPIDISELQISLWNMG